MGFLSIVTGVAKTILPHAINFIKGGVNGVMSGLDGDLAGMDASVADPTRYSTGLRFLAGANKILDSPLDDNDRKGEECLVVTNEEISKRQALEAMVEQARIEHLALEMPVEGLTKSQVIVTGTYNFKFGPKLLDSSNGENDEVINYIEPGDHVSFQLTPRRYNNFTQLTKHELVKFRTCRITSQVTSGYDTSTVVGYIPFVKNTKDINNVILGMLTKRINLLPSEQLDFTIRYTSPALVDYNKVTGVYTPQSLYLEPNKVIRADYIKHLYKEEGNTQTMFSYGTVIVLKENTGEQTVSCKYKVEMIFDVWDYIDTGMSLEKAQEEWDEEHSIVPSGSGSAATVAPARRRRAAN